MTILVQKQLVNENSKNHPAHDFALKADSSVLSRARKFTALNFEDDCSEWEIEKQSWGCWGGGPCFLPNEGVYIDSDFDFKTMYMHEGKTKPGHDNITTPPVAAVSTVSSVQTVVSSSEEIEQWLNTAKSKSEPVDEISGEKNPVWVLGWITALRDLRLMTWITSVRQNLPSTNSQEFTFDIESKTIWSDKHGLGYKVKAHRNKSTSEFHVFTFMDIHSLKKLFMIVGDAMRKNVHLLNNKTNNQNNKSSAPFAEAITRYLMEDPLNKANIQVVANHVKQRTEFFNLQNGRRVNGQNNKNHNQGKDFSRNSRSNNSNSGRR
eukprot:GDKJ01035577.1.p1 GENE.GDKJ01035577.1~~GDKJ01035577.1.p1  ORF type:complete len:321 (+),score=53.68 GDKJ01035577.1:22-984(+)